MNSQEEHVGGQLNMGVVPCGVDVHCLMGLLKAWFREFPIGVLDSLRPPGVSSLPPTKATLLDWAINLMADVVEHEDHNKMNARNIAMVFSLNMTQMAGPLMYGITPCSACDESSHDHGHENTSEKEKIHLPRLGPHL